MVQRRRNQAEFQLLQPVLYDLGKLLQRHDVVAAHADDFMKEGDDALPDLLVFLSFSSPSGPFVIAFPLLQRLGNAQVVQPSVQQRAPVCQGMVFLRLFPARPQGVPYGAADAIDMPYRFFFAFVYAMAFLDIAASSVLPVFAGQPVIAPDAVSQAIVFQIVGITPADREQIRLQQLKQRLVSPSGRKHVQQGGNGLRRRMGRHGMPVIAEKRNAVFGEYLLGNMVIRLAGPR